jgi:plastocyanin
MSLLTALVIAVVGAIVGAYLTKLRTPNPFAEIAAPRRELATLREQVATSERERIAQKQDDELWTAKFESAVTQVVKIGPSLMVRSPKAVIAGFGDIAATPGGQESLSVVRFIDGTVEIHAGDTVEWANWDPIIGHTITFGTEPADLLDPSCGPSPGCQVLKDTDGALHATITGPEQNVHSGFISAALEGYTGGLPAPQLPLFPPTRFRDTFTAPGTYNYICSLHDNLGMGGKVIVLP